MKTMASRTTSPTCFQNHPQMLHPSYENPAEEESHHHRVASADFDSIKVGGAVDNEPAAISLSPTLIFNLSVLQDKVHQVQSLVTLLISTGQVPPESSAMVMVSSMGTLIQEIIFTASSMMFNCQQMATTGNNTVSQPRVGLSSNNRSSSINNLPVDGPVRGESSLYPETGVDWITDHQSNVSSMISNTNQQIVNPSSFHLKNMTTGSKRGQNLSQANGGNDWSNSSKYDIIELDASELLAKYTHYCQICEKGFKRDANLRMHMRAHGDEYKSSSALSNPLKKRPSIDPDGISIITNDEHVNGNPINKVPRKYSCPLEGCRWNQRHAKFQPLKSMICVKNHYKRNHCPKMYVCKQCNTKQFSILSDLRTHEKHCGDNKWKCSCGTTFSRKDKLMGHVTLFTGHSPIISLTKPTSSGKVEQWSISSMQIGNMQENL